MNVFFMEIILMILFFNIFKITNSSTDKIWRLKISNFTELEENTIKEKFLEFNKNFKNFFILKSFNEHKCFNLFAENLYISFDMSSNTLDTKIINNRYLY